MDLIEKAVTGVTTVVAGLFVWVWNTNNRVTVLETQFKERADRQDQMHRENLSRFDRVQESIDDVRDKL